MKKIIAYFFVKINLAIALTLLFTVGSARGQDFPEGLVGLSSRDEAAVLYSIDASTGQATPIVTLNGRASLTGLSFLQGTLYGTDLFNFPGNSGGLDIGSISTGGIITFLSDQNGSFDWQGLASDEAGGVLYTIDLSNSDILTVQSPDGSVETIGSGTGISAQGMAYDDANGILYAISFNGSLYTISIATGTSNLIGPTGIPEISPELGLAYDECNQILYVNDGGLRQLYTLDVNSGAATLVGSNGVVDIIDGLAWKGICEITSPSQIPTLSEWGLIALAGILGIVGFIFMRRKKVTV